MSSYPVVPNDEKSSALRLPSASSLVDTPTYQRGSWSTAQLLLYILSHTYQLCCPQSSFAAKLLHSLGTR